MSMFKITQNDLSSFDCALFKGYGLDGVMVDSLPPSIVENKPYAIDEGCLSNLCRFVTLMMSMPPMDGIGCDADVEFDVVFKGRPFDGVHLEQLCSWILHYGSILR